jgi:hypothetical protein
MRAFRLFKLPFKTPVTFSLFSCFCISNQLYFISPQQSRHPERSASPIYRKQGALWRGVEGPRRCSLTDALASFTPDPFKLLFKTPVTFSLFSCFCISSELYFISPNKAVILSEALRRSIANRALYGAESKSLSRAQPREPPRCSLADALASFPAANYNER